MLGRPLEGSQIALGKEPEPGKGQEVTNSCLNPHPNPHPNPRLNPGLWSSNSIHVPPRPTVPTRHEHMQTRLCCADQGKRLVLLLGWSSPQV